MYPRSILAYLLAAALVLPPCSLGQQVSGPSSKLVEPSGGLKIVVIQGEGAVNSIRSKTATQPVVEVRDQNDKPVEGAEVIFSLPAAGAGGVFNGWMRTQTTKTNAQGQAAASGFTPNDEAGRFNIKVTAGSGGKSASLVIAQTNSSQGGAGRTGSGISGKWKALLVVGAVALGGGIYAAKRGNGTTTTVYTPVTVTSGPVTVAGPR